MPNETLDLTEWHQDLSDYLDRLSSAYRRESGDPHALQHGAFAALCKVVTSLNALPEMREGMRPLEALMLAYQGLTFEGKSDPLLESHVKTVGARRLSEAQKILQGRGVGMVELMLEAGWTESEAAKTVTELLKSSGVRGSRKNQPLTIGALRSWRGNANSGSYPDVREYADSVLDNAREIFNSLHGRWPWSKPEAVEFVTAITRVQSFRDLVESASANSG